MAEESGWYFNLPMIVAAGVPELVEVISVPAPAMRDLRELARVRCEIEEAMDALESVIRDIGRERLASHGLIRRQLASYQQMLNHVAQHLRWALDPNAHIV